MGRFTSRDQLLGEITAERQKLEALLAEIPADLMQEEAVVDGMTVKDLLAHRAEWGQMLLDWYATSAAGGTPAVPSEQYKWNQLSALNAEILERYANASLADVRARFERVHDDLRTLVEGLGEEELLTKGAHPFTGSTDLAAYVNSATAAHYRSAAKHIRRWWKARVVEGRMVEGQGPT